MDDKMLSMIDGMSQKERLIPALLPDNIHIDEKDIPDLLKYITEISSHLIYYDSSNQANGTWESFFKSDVHVLISLISKFDLPGHINRFFQLEFQFEKAINHDEKLRLTGQLFAFVFELTKQMHSIHFNLLNAKTAETFPVDLRLIDLDFELELSKLRNYNEEINKFFGVWFIDKHAFREINFEKEVQPLFTKNKESGNLTTILNYLKDVFDRLGSNFNTLYNAGLFYLQKTDLYNQQYPAHLALVMAFLKLFSSLQKPLNQLTEKHLDLYYKKILGLEFKGPQADSVHVLFEAVPRVQEVRLNRGEELFGELPVTKEQVVYGLDEDIIVTHAQIQEIKTIYVSQHIQSSSVESNSRDIKELQIFKAINDLNTNWPVMGEDPADLPDGEHNMEVAELGIMISSPILYQPYGIRNIELNIYIEDASFDELSDYFKNFAGPGKYNADIPHKLLSNAFLIYLTASQGWISPPKIKIGLDETEKCLRITISLDITDDQIVVYDSLLHGDNYQLKWPALKLMINNNAGHNALTFLRNTEMSRITINAKVNRNNHLFLQNTNGPLSAANPFQPFGPLAPVGSYLEIRNANIFNRYTIGANINLEWEGLPQLPGGWETYYKAYENNIKNSSFRVKISTDKTKRIKAQTEEFKLFDVEYNKNGDEILSDTTIFKDINVISWELTNDLVFEKDSLTGNPSVNENIRIELISPEDGFGSRLFNSIFPSIALHNSKWHNKKRDLPIPPYIPVLRSISVDYELQDTVDLYNATQLSQEDLSIKLIHLYPFGHKEIFPQNGRLKYPLIPHFDYEQHLFIGFTGLWPGQELSVLFQLEESSFSSKAEKSGAIQWSCLYNNEWLSLDDQYVLYDSTSNFMQTGIVKLLIPDHINTANTILSSSLLWIRASRPCSKVESLKVTGMYLNAASATRILQAGDQISKLNIEKGTITGIKRPVKEIQSVNQPSASFGGRYAETRTMYYTRVSERLRHKQRLLNPIDIEQAILENFPEINMAKCLRAPGNSETANKISKHVDIHAIVISKSLNNISSEQPKVSISLLCDIQTYLEKSLSGFIRISVENPVYERIKVICKLKFKRDRSSDLGLYKKRFHEDIKKYLCPWLYDTDHEFRVGSGLLITDMLNYIKKLDYISHVTGFSVVHYYNYTNQKGEVLTGMKDFAYSDSNLVKGSVPGAILIPALQHYIEIISETADFDLYSNNYSRPQNAGVKKLVIGEDLVIGDQSAENQKEEKTNTINTGPRFNWVIAHKLIKHETQSD